jgi:hypothetical protein
MVELMLELGTSGHADNRRIASVPLHGFCGHRSTAVELTGWSAGEAGQGVNAGTDDQLRSRARAVSPAPGSTTAELHHGVGTTLPVTTLVILGRLHQSGQCRPHRRSAFGIEQAIDTHHAGYGLTDVKVAALVGTVRLGQGGGGIDAVFKALDHGRELSRVH